MNTFTDDALADIPRKPSFKMVNAISGICRGCSHAQIIKQRHKNETTVICHGINHWTPTLIPDNIEECTSFKAPMDMSMWDMRQIAWDIEITRKAGFAVTTPEERKRKD